MNAFIQADVGLQLFLQGRVLKDLVAPQRLLDHEQAKLIELFQMLKIFQAICRIGIAAQHNLRPALTDARQHSHVPARLYFDFDALVSRRQFALNLLQQLFD